MKKLLSLILCVAIAFSCVGFGGCADNKPKPVEKPVINLSTDEKDISANFIRSYELPTAECKSSVDKKKLPVRVTATTEAGAAAVVEEGYLKPTTLGKYVIHYNATDKDEAKTKADEKSINITFVDGGATITPKSNISSITSINTYTKYVIPAFSDVATISYDLKNLVDSDFTATAVATFTALGAVEKQPIADNVTPARYAMGTIEVVYSLSTTSDATVKPTYKLEVTVGDGLFTGLKQRGSDVPCTITKEEVPAIKADGYVIKVATSGAWGGAKLTGPSDILSIFNESQDNALVINAYNPTSYWGRFFFAVYDDSEYTGIKGNFGNKYIVAPHEHFQMIIPKKMHVGNVNIFDISIQADTYAGEPLVNGAVQAKDDTYPASEIYLISAEVINENTETNKATITKVWENNAIPTTLGVYDSQNGTTVAQGYAVSTFARAEDTVNNIPALDGLKILNTTGHGVIQAVPGVGSEPGTPEVPATADGYFDFLSDANTAQMIKEKFAEARLTNYGNYFAYTVHNITDVDQKIWVMLGYQSNARQYDTGANWLYELTVPANGSREVYMNASSRGDEGHRTPFEVVRISLDKQCELVINNVRIVNYKNFKNEPTKPFTMTLKGAIDTIQNSETAYTVPAFVDAYDTSFPATGVITSVKHRNPAGELVGDVSFNAPITLEKGYYDITYTVTETATERIYTKVLTIEVLGVFDPVEKLPAEIKAYKNTTDYETYTLPTFDTVFNCYALHTSAIAKVEFKDVTP